MSRAFGVVALVAAAVAAIGSVFGAPGATANDLEKRVHELEQHVAELKQAPGTDAAKVAELERQIQILAQEIESLKLGEAAPAPSGPSHGLGPSASKVYGAKKGVSIGGYGEGLYSNPSSTLQDGTPSGREAQLDWLRAVLYFGVKFDDRILFNSEIEVEHATTGEGGEARGEVALEFAYLDFLVRPQVNVRAGLVLVPMGFVNERHEPPTYFGTRRPLVETIVLPTTWSEIGVGVYGEVGPKVTYRAYVTSGLAAAAGNSSGAEGFTAQGIRDGRAEGSQAAAEDLALTGRIDGDPVTGLTIGASFFTGDAGQKKPVAGGRLSARTTIVDGHVEYRWRGLQLRGLYARTTIAHAEEVNAAQGFAGSSSVGSRQYGWYGEGGYDVLTHVADCRHALIPYLRYERLDTQNAVPAGFAADPANDLTLTTAGLQWKPIPNVSVKVDWNRTTTAARTGFDEWNLALGYMF
jgi:hypothetical protein